MIQRRRRTSGLPGNGFSDPHREVVERRSTKRARNLAPAATLLPEALGTWNQSVELSARTKIYCEGVRNAPIWRRCRIWVPGPYLLVGRTE
jgi:hypothetical protein